MNAENPTITSDGRITLRDGGGRTLVLLFEDGTLKVSGLRSGQMKTQAFKTRGRTYAVRKTEDQEVEVSFEGHCTGFLGDGTDALLLEAVMRLGSWSGAVSSLPTSAGDADLTEVYFELNTPGATDSTGAPKNSTALFRYADLEADFSEGIPGKISVKGPAYPIGTNAIEVT